MLQQEADQMTVIMPEGEGSPDRESAETGQIWWILARPQGSGVIQIGRIYDRVEEDAEGLRTVAGYGAEFDTVHPVPVALRGRIFEPTETFDGQWLVVAEELRKVGAFPRTRRWERPAIEAPVIF